MSLHSDPAVARKAGFDRPILHGLATYGVAARALLAGLCDSGPERMKSMDARFSSPAWPGELLAVDEEGEAAFRARVPAPAFSKAHARVPTTDGA